MTPPRQIHPGQLCFVTVRAVNRCYRFAPKTKTLQIIWYCLARTLDKYRGRIAAHEFLWMSNHYHLVLTDQGGCLPRFMEELNSLLARALNALHGIHGTAIEKGYNLVIATEGKLVEHSVYTLANPCSAHLVERSRHWKGVSSRNLEYGVGITVKRPECGLWSPDRHVQRGSPQEPLRRRSRPRSRLPGEVELILTRPAILPQMSDQELRRHIRERLGERERMLIADRRTRGLRVVGWNAARRVDVRAAPQRAEQRSRTVPHCSADTREARIAARNRRREFLRHYDHALRRFFLGERTVEFPAGTWLMRVRFGVTCCPLPET